MAVGAGVLAVLALFALTVGSEAPLLVLDPRRRRRRRSRRRNDASVSAAVALDPPSLLRREREPEPDEIDEEDEAEDKTSVSPLDPPLGFFEPPFPLPEDGRSVGSKAGSAVPSAKAAAGARRSNAKERFMVRSLGLLVGLWFGFKKCEVAAGTSRARLRFDSRTKI